MNLTVPVVVGPTSSGKTSLAIKICELTGAHIISADSRQVYKYMDVGTGKLPLNSTSLTIEKAEGYWQIDGTTIWGYDLATPREQFNAGLFAQCALAKIHELTAEKIPVIVVGGTGFFVDVLTGKIQLNSAPADTDLRNTLDSQSLDNLLKELNELSVEEFIKIDKKNKVRVIRAIERLKSKSDELVNLNRNGIAFKYFGLTAERNVLYANANEWASRIWGDILFNEVNRLINQGYIETQPLRGIVYKTALEYLQNNISFAQGLERVQFDLHSYIRRQQTWFKKNSDIHWLNAEEVEKNISIIAGSLYT